MKFQVHGTVNHAVDVIFKQLNVEHRTSNVQYRWRSALSIYKQGKRSLLRAQPSRISKGKFALLINPATKLIIPAVAERRAGIQIRLFDYWIPAFAGLPGW